MNKYRNIPTTFDGHCFASKAEVRRYVDLKLLEKIEEIHDLELQPKFEIIPAINWNGKRLRARYYIADFLYKQGDITYVEDVKSKFTAKNPVYTLKRQLFLIRYPGYVFREVF